MKRWEIQNEGTSSSSVFQCSGDLLVDVVSKMKKKKMGIVLKGRGTQ